MMKVVIDTNVFISRFLSPQGTPARIIELAEAGAFHVLVSETLVSEYERTLQYEHVRKVHGLTAEQLQKWASNLRRIALFVQPTTPIDVIFRDPDDNKFIECALAGGADYIVSGDKHLLDLREYAGIRILSPADFLRVLELEQA
jgi:hypothetical protein